MERSVLDCLKQGQDVSQIFPGADRGNYFAAGLIRIAAQSCLCAGIHPSFQQVTHLPRAPQTSRRWRNWTGTAPLLCGSPPSTSWHHWGNKEGLQNSGLNRARENLGLLLKIWGSETYLVVFYQNPVISKRELAGISTKPNRSSGTGEGREEEESGDHWKLNTIHQIFILITCQPFKAIYIPRGVNNNQYFSYF